MSAKLTLNLAASSLEIVSFEKPGTNREILHNATILPVVHATGRIVSAKKIK